MLAPYPTFKSDTEPVASKQNPRGIRKVCIKELEQGIFDGSRRARSKRRPEHGQKKLFHEASRSISDWDTTPSIANDS